MELSGDEFAERKMSALDLPIVTKFEIPSNPSFLPMIRDIISHIAELSRFDTAAAKSIVLAVDEAFTNIVKYAYEGDFSQKVSIFCTGYEDRIEIIMKDVSTLRYQPQRLWEWEKMAMRMAEEYGG